MEEWRVVPYYPKYEVSSHGRVKSIGRQSKLLKLQNHNKGYLSVRIGGDSILVHTIVAWTFLGLQPMGYDVHHKDHNKTNNHISNIEYIKKCEHLQRHEWKPHYSNRYRYGNNATYRKLDEQQVINIRKMFIRGKFGYTRLAKLFAISRTQIRRIINGENWTKI